MIDKRLLGIGCEGGLDTLVVITWHVVALGNLAMHLAASFLITLKVRGQHKCAPAL